MHLNFLTEYEINDKVHIKLRDTSTINIESNLGKAFYETEIKIISTYINHYTILTNKKMMGLSKGILKPMKKMKNMVLIPT